MSAIGSFDRSSRLICNSNGTEAQLCEGCYEFSVEICAGDGERTTGLDYTGVAIKDLDTPFMDLGDLKKHFQDIEKSIYPETVSGKFEGTVIMTPGTAAEFIFMTLNNYAGNGVIIDGTSQWLDKVGEKVADEKLTVRFDPYDERIDMGERATANGFLSEAYTVIEKGVLKTHQLSLYGANKTGRPVVKNTGWDIIIEPGDTSYDDMLKSVKKGIILGRFSGGSPGANGEFSGVAKNSFLVEDGKVKCAVSEAMISGNLGEVVKNISSISKELICDGGSVLPYMAVEGIIISGK
jgi:PmbA protein